MKKLFLIDAYALIFKYYYAFMGRPMRNRDGMNTSVIFGFTKFLRDIIRRERPDLLGVAFDPPGGSFRRRIYPLYKANRPATPEDIITSVPYVKRLLAAMCIPVLEVEDYEADDVIGTLAHKGVAAGYEVYMVTPDKDYGQLVREHCSIYKQKGEGVEIVDVEAIRAHYGFDDPALVSDVLALWGDASDNIPGVPGIGEKGAAKLVAKWGGVENIILNAEAIGGKTGQSISSWVDNLRRAKALTQIVLDVPIEFSAESLTMCSPDSAALRTLFAELNFTSMLRDIDNIAPAEPDAPADDTPRQQAQTQLADMARAKSAAKRKAALQGQGDLFSASAPAGAAVDSSEAEPDSARDEAAEPQPVMATAATTPHDYRTVRTTGELASLVDEWRRCEEICFDTETTGLDPVSDAIIGISIAVEPHKAWYIPFERDTREELAELLRLLFEDESVAKVGQNMKFDIMMLRRAGIEVRGRKYDTMIMHYLLDPESRHNMDYLSERYLNYSPIPIETLIGKGARRLTMDMVGLDRVAEYAAEDADVTLRLKHALYPELAEASMLDLYSRIEEPMIDTLADMETAGVRIDTRSLADYSVELGELLSRLEERIRALADEPTLNINSARQLGEVLFAKMRITDKPKMTRTKQFSTEEEYLQGFAHEHEIVRKVLEYRGVKKLLSTYVDALPELVNPRTGRIHTSYNQAVTATGRLSSTNPNLQNIPIRDALGKPIRAAFVAADEDHLLLSADYSQIELRLMAHLSGDDALIEAFVEGRDIHAATAARLYRKNIDEVTDDERRRAKTANFGIIYGISAFGLSQRLDIPRKEAKEIIDGYFASYPDVKRYMDEVVEKAKERGYVETIFGRRRILADIDSRNAVARSLAERNAINAPIQGSAADIMKIAMVEIRRRFLAEGIRSRMILQVHDEVVVDTLRSEVDAVRRIVTEAMQGAARLRVPLIAECGTGDNWLEAH